MTKKKQSTSLSKKSKLELEFEFLIKIHKIQAPEEQYKFCPTRRFRFDYAYPGIKLAIEIDGGQWQAFGGRHSRDSDREKLNIAASLGWRVLRFSGEMLKNTPDKCMKVLLDCLD